MMLLHVFFLYHTHTHTYTHICRWHSNQKTKWESVSEKKIQTHTHNSFEYNRKKMEQNRSESFKSLEFVLYAWCVVNKEFLFLFFFIHSFILFHVVADYECIKKTEKKEISEGKNSRFIEN